MDYYRLYLITIKPAIDAGFIKHYNYLNNDHLLPSKVLIMLLATERPLALAC